MSQYKKQNKFRYGFKKWADDTSIQFRIDLGLNQNDPLCAFVLSDHLGIPIFTPQLIPDLKTEYVDQLLGNGKEQWSAATVPISDTENIILHNPTHSSARQQSNLMHELAHVICGHKVPEEIVKTGLIGFLRNHNEQQENEAEWLGSCLQLPRPALIWALKKEMSNFEIAEHFNASEEMVKYRINVTGVKKQLINR
jgi:hypothetical protein